MDKIMYRNFQKAKQEGRLCEHCGWMISKTNWKKGYRKCGSCFIALKGVVVNNKYGYGKYHDEPIDRTGEMP